MILLEGRSIAEIKGVRHELRPQDTTFIPPNLPHRFLNASVAAALIATAAATLAASQLAASAGLSLNAIAVAKFNRTPTTTTASTRCAAAASPPSAARPATPAIPSSSPTPA